MKRCILLILVALFSGICHSQILSISSQKGLNVIEYSSREHIKTQLQDDIQLFSFKVDGKSYNLKTARLEQKDTSILFSFDDHITAEVFAGKTSQKGWKCRIVIYNNTADTVDIENVVPFSETPGHIYLTSTGPWALARAKIFRPGLGPIGVILPDNAWEMGYGALDIDKDNSVCALARRTKSDKAEWRRYRTIVYPGGNVEYSFWANDYSGDWQNGLRLMFQEMYLYDVEAFNDSLYHRSDLEWIRHSYLIGLQFAWNREYYDWQKQDYTVDPFLERGKELFGGYDVIGLWPTWPRLGVDERNQWDLFSDLPGGLDQIKNFSRRWKQEGTKFFICYNPWDESTRTENPYAGMAQLIQATDADGVVLDCHGASSYQLQHAADSVRRGVIMYSEGMAVVEDMPGIVAGRVHDAIYLPPPLNLNKLIRPDFAIFRVCQMHDGRIRREASVAFFNGYGTELNTFAPGQFDNMEDDLLYLGMTTKILRENTSNFLSWQWTPLLPTLADSIWVNKWPLEKKTIYTVYSLIPGGFRGPLFEGDSVPGFHLVSLWHHQELQWVEKDGRRYIPATTESFNSYDLDTRTEGNIDCIALLPELIRAELSGGILKINATEGDEIRIWAGIPTYQNKREIVLKPGSHELNTLDLFGNYEGKIVIQLFSKNELADERILTIEPGTPRLMGKIAKTPTSSKPPKGMVLINGGTFNFTAENTDQFIPYPDIKEPVVTELPTYFIDKYPVTNKDFAEFLTSSRYRPSDTINFLKHWDHGKIPPGLDNHPVVYISLEDARAYAIWAGKRLPSETEWQYAAQGSDGRQWPWGNEFDSTKCNNAFGKTSSVNDFPKGKSPFGVMDLTGNVWQFTGDVYNNGTYYFVIMKGGSFYKPTSSWWYVKGGPQPNTWHQQLLLVSPGFDRNATVGFRCVKDYEK
jgi:formylglycine-generating enzyme required for sulfatase activity